MGGDSDSDSNSEVTSHDSGNDVDGDNDSGSNSEVTGHVSGNDMVTMTVAVTVR